MNGWTVFVADVLGICLAVARILWREDRTDRHLRLGGVALGGTLTALVALRAEVMPFLVVLILVGLAVLAGVWFRPTVIKWREMKGFTRVAPLGRHPFVLVALVVVMTVLIWPGPKPPTTEERDTARYGAKINRHVDGVTSRVLDRTPTVADAGTGREPVKAVPIEKYARDGQVLTLVVLHSALCEPVEVLLALAGTSLEVVVFVAPYEIYASSPPSDPPSCRIADRSDPFAWHTALDVVLPAGLTASAVRDVGAGGPALAVSPPG